LDKGDCRIVVNGLGVHRSDDTDVIHNLGVMGKELADVGAGLAHLVKFLENGSGYGKRALAGSHSRNALALANGIRQFGPVILAEFRFVIKEFNLRRGTRLVKKDTALALGAKLRHI